MLLTLLACVHPLPPTMSPAEIVPVTTSDGWVNDLRHYPGEGPPVLLVHGMSANHYNFDYREEVSVADALVDAGWDVWIPELRGDPGSVAPSRHAARRITFDQHAEQDVPAAVHEVLARTGRDRLYWVGHSMGGMLLYSWLSQEPETVAAGVAICSPSTFASYELPWVVRPISLTLGGAGKVPARALAAATRPLGRSNPLYGRVANRDNLDWALAGGISRHILVDIPKPLARQALGWVRSGALTTVDGEPWVAAADVPLLVLGAPLDKVVSEADVRATCDLFPDCRYQYLAKSEGFSEDYGHVDPVIGREARSEIYPLVLGFLTDHAEPVLRGASAPALTTAVGPP